jgi:hypothetical protein
MLAAMVRQKSRLMRVKLPPAADDALGKVAAHLALERSSALRFLVLEKARALGLPLSIDAELELVTEEQKAIARASSVIAPKPRRRR